jgi:hypothetical protein
MDLITTVVNGTRRDKRSWERRLNGIRTNQILMTMVHSIQQIRDLTPLDALPAGQHYYANYNRRGRKNPYGRRGRSRGRGWSMHDDRQSQQSPTGSEGPELWPALPSTVSSEPKDQ